jgi:uncharacterized protein YbgA (DUF1722 family)/uncharacterized protein YbbK (DUF523 family)
MIRDFPKPIIVVSRCLGFEAVRYNGGIIRSDFVDQLKPYVDYVTVCPEVEIGLGVPREPVRIVMIKNQRRLIQPSTGQDLTDKINRFSGKFLKSLGEVDGFIMKNRSPSSGIKDVKIYGSVEKSPPIRKGAGFFGGRILEMFPGHPVEDEGRLLNAKIREHFLIRIFALASFRQMKSKKSMAELVKFQADNKFLLMSYNQKEMRILGRIVANHEKHKIADVLDYYEIHLRLALNNPARRKAIINTLMHTLGFFSTNLSAKEKAHFLKRMESYRKGKLSLPALLEILKVWIIHYEEGYLDSQTLFEPYPEPLTVTVAHEKEDNAI